VQHGKHLQKVIGALLIVAILHTIFAMSELLAARSAIAAGAAIDKGALTGTMLLPVMFVLLAVWARWAPAAASVVGLLAYLGILAFDTIVRRMPVGQGIVIKILIVIALVRAVQVGIEYNRVRRRIAMGEMPTSS
jgi:hypothetical protein